MGLGLRLGLGLGLAELVGTSSSSEGGVGSAPRSSSVSSRCSSVDDCRPTGGASTRVLGWKAACVRVRVRVRVRVGVRVRVSLA